ncbi:MAG: transcription termination/antitermination protein NusA [Anaerolineae bacterium]|nr:transcription termination/antitermination protein NusA [Anaerolineae bacterium]
MKNEFVLAINEIIDARALPRETILDALQTALVSAYRRDVSVSSAQRVEAEVDMNVGSVTLLVEKEVVDSVQDVRTEVAFSHAKQIDPEIAMGDMLMVPIEDPTRKFGRIAAQTAKQVILQKIREAERETLYEEYVEREGDLISGTVQSVTPQGVTISLGRAEALLPRTHMMPGERYRPHDKVRTFLLEVKKGNRGPQIIVSRSHRNMLRRLLEYEVPEIYNGQVEIKNIAREAGHRSKVAVAALQEGVDPVGACVGMRGIRIQNIVRELNEEKIDVIEWSADASVFITKALSPARVAGVYLDEFADTGRGGMGTATVIVPDDQLSLAIGREGQNARLAAKLTGWRIDIKSVSEAVATALQNTESKALTALLEKQTALVEEVNRIVEKRNLGRPVMPEEFQTLMQFARLGEEALLSERRKANKQHQDHLQTVRETLPPAAFDVPVNEMPLPQIITRALGSRFETAGDVMLYMLVDEDRVQKSLRRVPQDGAFEMVKEALENLVLPEPVEEEALEAEAAAEEVLAAEAEPEAPEETLVAEEAPAAETDEVPEAEALEATPEEVLPAFAEEEIEPEEDLEPAPAFVEPEIEEPEEEEPAYTAPSLTPAPPHPEYRDLDDEFGDKKSKQGKSRRRQLVYDEDAGKVIAKRKRKGSRRRPSYLDEIEDEL